MWFWRETEWVFFSHIMKPRFVSGSANSDPYIYVIKKLIFPIFICCPPPTIQFQTLISHRESQG
ncbi:hypothetical protein HanIR_Chr08g0364911 [Helianthus annuus]|nr:hypothetical protein HanIR_Chr08g0364911 [Helianthus annuus]